MRFTNLKGHSLQSTDREIKDNKTGLIWQRYASQDCMSYWAALIYCQKIEMRKLPMGAPSTVEEFKSTMKILKQMNWRLPTREEFQHLMGGTDGLVAKTIQELHTIKDYALRIFWTQECMLFDLHACDYSHAWPFTACYNASAANAHVRAVRDSTLDTTPTIDSTVIPLLSGETCE